MASQKSKERKHTFFLDFFIRDLKERLTVEEKFSVQRLLQIF